jgi:hypothetical protein
MYRLIAAKELLEDITKLVNTYPPPTPAGEVNKDLYDRLPNSDSAYWEGVDNGERTLAKVIKDKIAAKRGL